MSKLSKRAITLFVIATMVLSMLSAFIIVPVMAGVYLDADLASSTATEDDAVWATDPAATPTRGDVAKLSILSGGSWAQVRIYPDTTLTLSGLDAELTTDPIVYDWYIKSGEGNDHPDIELRFEDSAGNGWVEIGLYTYETFTTDVWNTVATYDLNGGSGVGNGHVTAYGSSTGASIDIDEGGSMSTSDIVTDVIAAADGAGTWVLERIAIQVGYGQAPDLTAYVDNICFAGTTYDLEVITPGGGFTIDYVTLGNVVYDQVLTVIGSGVTSGSTVNVYWDYVTAANLLNVTIGKPSGEFECTVEVPSAVYGNHYLWVKDIASGISIRSDAIPVIPKIKLSPSSGLIGDEVTIKGYGFSDEAEVKFDFDPIGSLTTSPALVETDEDGYFKCTFDVPTVISDGDHEVTATETETTANKASATFTVGASISLDPEEGPSGKVVTITGRGWTFVVDGEDNVITLMMGNKAVTAVDETDIIVGSNGKFSAKVVIPSMEDEKDYDIIATESETDYTSKASFEVTGNSAIKIAPGYGPPGGSIEIKGYNFTQISGTKIILTLYDSTLGTKDIDTIETDSRGEFSETIRIPAVDYGTWELWANDTVYDLSAEKDFRIGIMIVIVSPSYGPTGTAMSLTGIGFTKDMTWNATMDGVAITEKAEPIGEFTEAISKLIYIPTIPEGTYTITVLDIDTEIEVPATFTVTAVTEVSMDPASAPNLYNVTVNGLNFAEYEGTSLDFVLYNATEEWDMDVYQTIDGENEDALTDEDGEFTAWWEVLDDETLSIGTYTVNVTDGEDLFAQTTFSIVKARVSVTPRKALFDRGDTIQFNVRNDFDFDDSYMKIYDPDDNLYWQTETFVGWVKTAELYTVPYYMQTSGGNPMELSIDAPLGTWFWAFYTDPDTQLVNGTFVVGPSAEALITEQIQALSEELGMDIDTLRVYIDDLGIDMDDAVSSMAAEIATAVAAAEATAIAVADIGETAEDALDAANDAVSAADAAKAAADAGLEAANAAQTTAQQAADAADKAADAAETTQQQTSGLTGLVYGAIGASLIAALAAIVSLMQISRRIAG